MEAAERVWEGGAEGAAEVSASSNHSGRAPLSGVRTILQFLSPARRRSGAGSCRAQPAEFEEVGRRLSPCHRYDSLLLPCAFVCD